MSLKTFKKKNAALVLAIANDIAAQKPGYGDVIVRAEVAKRVGQDPEDRTFRMAFHAARDELVEFTPSYCFKVKVGSEGGEYVRMTEEERGDKAVLRYMRKAKEAAYRGIRRGVRTKLPDNAPPDVKREHERRLIQASNVFHDIKTGIRSATNGKWFGMNEASPEPLPSIRPVPSPEKPKGSRWLGLDQKDDDKGQPPAQAPKKT